MDEAEHDEPFRADHSEFLVLVVLSFEPILHVQEVQVHFEGMLRDTVFAKDAHRSDLVSNGDCKHFARGRNPACENVTNAELFDETFALAGKCNEMSDTSEFVSTSSCVKPTVETNLAPLVSISLFIVLIETLVETFAAHRLCLCGFTSYCQTTAGVIAQI